MSNWGYLAEREREGEGEGFEPWVQLPVHMISKQIYRKKTFHNFLYLSISALLKVAFRHFDAISFYKCLYLFITCRVTKG